VRFPGPRRAEQHHVLVGVQEVELGQVQHLRFLQRAREREVELLEGLSGRKTRSPDAKLPA
jgi:hypothetical protein